jgi:hypothetical protein
MRSADAPLGPSKKADVLVGDERLRGLGRQFGLLSVVAIANDYTIEHVAYPQAAVCVDVRLPEVVAFFGRNGSPCGMPTLPPTLMICLQMGCSRRNRNLCGGLRLTDWH